MTDRGYSKKESLNRILRALKGTPVSSETPESVQSPVLSEDEALSDMAELFASSLPGVNAYPIPAMSRYASMYFAEGVDLVVDILASGAYARVNSGSVAGSLNGFTFQNSRELKATQPGKYMIHWQMSAHTAGVAQMQGCIMVNGSGQNKALAFSASLGSAIPTSFGAYGIFTLAKNDVIALAVRNCTDANDITVRDANITVFLLGV